MKNSKILNEELKDEILECEETDEISDELLEIFGEIAENQAQFIHINGSKDDFIKNAIEACCKHWKTGDGRSFNQIIAGSLCSTWAKNKRNKIRRNPWE